jgi:DNA (cytosine-5)-methyltransferase 1
MGDPRAKEVLKKLHAAVEKNDPLIVQAVKQRLAYHPTVSCENPKMVPPNILKAIETIIDNKSANKYLFSILLACCIKKIIDPEQDITIGQDNMAKGYSNRSFDQTSITPFLKRHGYTHCEASGLESGRNFERPLPWGLKYPSNPRGAGNREAFLGILHYVQVESGNPEDVAFYLMLYDHSKGHQANKTTVPPMETQISKIMRIFLRHFNESAGQGKSRLPVLALYAIYSRMVVELVRYKGTELLPLERHTTADLRSGSIGDIQVNRNNEPYEGVEVKSEKSITPAMVRELPRKFSSRNVSRYYILSTADPYILKEDIEVVNSAVREVEKETGAQVIVNGIVRTLWYYLRLLENPATVLPIYRELLEADKDIRTELKESWNTIITEEYPEETSYQ